MLLDCDKASALIEQEPVWRSAQMDIPITSEVLCRLYYLLLLSGGNHEGKDDKDEDIECSSLYLQIETILNNELNHSLTRLLTN